MDERNYEAMQKLLKAQIKHWQNEKKVTPHKKVHPFITLTREYGSCGYEVAEKIAEVLNDNDDIEVPWAVYDKNIVEKIAEDMGLSEKISETLLDAEISNLTDFMNTLLKSAPSRSEIIEKQGKLIRTLALKGYVILVGRGGNPVTKKLKGGFNVRLTATMDWKIDRVSKMLEIDKDKAKKKIEKNTKERYEFRKKNFNFDMNDPTNFHITINRSRCSVEQSAGIIVESMKIMGLI